MASEYGPRRAGSLAPGYAVDGIEPSRVERPATVDALSGLLREADARGEVVVPWGGGTSMGLGNLPERVDLALDLRGLNEIVSYDPADLTVAVQAGMTLAELNRRLGAHGEMLPVDAADPERATIGGLVASGVAGPRRFGYGPLRDLLIGITVALPDGRLTKGGGMVVKNVTGFDMMRLHYGALGSLGVIVQVNLKVIPRPGAQRAVIARYADRRAALDAAMAVRLSQLGPTAIALLDRGAAVAGDLQPAAWQLVLRGEAPPAAADRQAERLAAAVAPGAEAVEVIVDGVDDLWARVSRTVAAPPVVDEIRVRLGARPSLMDAVLDRIVQLVPPEGRWMMVDLGAGLVYLGWSLSPERTGSAGETIERLRAIADHAVVLSAPATVKREIDVFGPEPEGFAVTRALKMQFDPHRTLNRGRFAGRL